MTATPDVLRDGVARADMAAEEGGVNAGVEAGGMPLQEDLEGVSTGKVSAGCDPGVDLEEGGAHFGFGGDADGEVIVGAVGDE